MALTCRRAAARMASAAPCFSRMPVELGCCAGGSLLPLHSAVAEARLTSRLSTASRSCRALSQGTGTIAYGFTSCGREARAAGAGPILGDWGSGYGISAQALTAVVRAYDGRGPETVLTNNILDFLGLISPDELIGWTYEDQSWARIADLLPVVVQSAEGGDELANKILHNSVGELVSSVKAVVRRLGLSGEGELGTSF